MEKFSAYREKHDFVIVSGLNQARSARTEPESHTVPTLQIHSPSDIPIIQWPQLHATARSLAARR
jgi:hypothetical protein